MNIKTTLTALWKSDARLTATSLVMIALLAATGMALMLDPRQITGAPAWLKPAKFAMSIAIYTLTLAWVFMYLPDWPRTRRVVSWVTTVTLLLEIVIIDVQAWRGTTSHFNVGTLVDGILFTIMGLAIVVQTVAAIALAVALWRQHFSDRALGWALRLGMTITIVGAMTGGLMTQPTRAQTRQRASRTAHDCCGRAHCRGARWRARPAGYRLEPGARRSSRRALSRSSRAPVASACRSPLRQARMAGSAQGADGLGYRRELCVILRVALVAGPARTISDRA